MSRQSVYISALVFTAYFYRASRSTRGENLYPSQTFPRHPHSPGHEHSIVYTWPSTFPKDISFPSRFSFSILFVPTITAALEVMLNNFN